MSRMSRPVIARISRTASIVDSVPELPNRQSGRPKRSDRCSPTTTESSVGWAKCVPRRTRSETISAMRGWAWPTAIAP